MPEAYSKLGQISKMMRHTENPGIIKTGYSSISLRSTFSNIQAIFSYVQANIYPCSGI